MSEQDLQALVSLAKEWVNILSITKLSQDYVAVAIEYTVPPDPAFKQSQYKTATRWVKYVAVLPAATLETHATLTEAVLTIVRGVRRVLENGRAR